jgi:hypothetical protein
MASGELLAPGERVDAHGRSVRDKEGHAAESPEELAPLPSNDGYMSELRELFRLALPIMATSVLTYFMGIVDLSMAGHLGKEVVPEALDLPCAPRSTLHSD